MARPSDDPGQGSDQHRRDRRRHGSTAVSRCHGEGVGEQDEQAADDPLLLVGEEAPRLVGDGVEPVGERVDVVVGGVGGAEPVEQAGDGETVLLARCALSAGLDGEEPGDALGDGDEIDRVVEHHEPGGARARSRPPPWPRSVTGVSSGGRRDERVGDARRERPDSERPSLEPAADLVDHVAQRAYPSAPRRRRRATVDPLTVQTTVPGDVGRADRAEPVGPVGQDAGDVGERLDVVGQRRRRAGAARRAGHLDPGR